MHKLQVTVSSFIARVQLSRPEVHHAIDAELIQNLTETFLTLGKDQNVRVIVLCSEGKNFCAGADVNWMKNSMQFTKEQNEEDAKNLHQMLETIYRCPKPVITRVQGAVFGGGVGLMASSDIAIASREAVFSLSEVRLGILPAVISTFVLRKIGMGAFRAYGLSGKRISAEEALRIGLVQEIVSIEDLDQTVDRWIYEFLQNGPQAMATLKYLSEEVWHTPSIEKSAEKTVQTIVKTRTGEEGQEGLKAFLEKRTPTWRIVK